METATLGMYAADAGYGYAAGLQLSSAGSADYHAGGAAAAAPAEAGDDGEVHVPVECGGVAGLLAVSRLRIIMNPGTATEREVSPTQFERLGGKGASKKWRLSIHVQNSERVAARGGRAGRRSRRPARRGARGRRPRDCLGPGGSCPPATRRCPPAAAPSLPPPSLSPRPTLPQAPSPSASG
jgi:hypothetical protein